MVLCYEVFGIKKNNFEKVAILGRVGCGKTTLLNTILKETFI